ncbi:MAG TPA: hypothetical protein VF103_09335, partial [Polyangiaceae bacterium]
ADEKPAGGEPVSKTQEAEWLCAPPWSSSEECITWVDSGCWWCQECHTGCSTWGCPDTPIFQTC